MKIWTTITNVAFYYNLKEDSVEGNTTWTINKNARPGDVCAMYVCAPVSAVVATAVIAEDPFQEKDLNSPFFNTYFAEMNELKMLDISITRHQMRELFPEWRYWLQPRNSVQTPPEFLVKFTKNLQECGAKIYLF